MSRLRLITMPKGCALVDEDGVQLYRMSWMDAAYLLFSIKDELRISTVGRACVDDVWAKRMSARNAGRPA